MTGENEISDLGRTDSTQKGHLALAELVTRDDLFRLLVCVYENLVGIDSQCLNTHYSHSYPISTLVSNLTLLKASFAQLTYSCTSANVGHLRFPERRSGKRVRKRLCSLWGPGKQKF
jgi:hypothetical protein